MKNFLTGLLMLISLLISGFAKAAVVNYESKIAVPNQSEAAKRVAIRQALSEIVVRNTGKADLLSRKEIQALLANAHDYIQSYRYISQKKKGVVQKFIQVTFDKEDVDELLQRTNQLSIAVTTVPGVSREDQASSNAASLNKAEEESKPERESAQSLSTDKSIPTVVWLTVKSSEQSKPELIEFGQGQPLEKLLELTALQKKITLLIPELDMENISVATENNLWNLDKSVIHEISARYGSAHILAGRLTTLKDGEWRGRWLFNQEGEWIERDTTGESAEANLSSILDVVREKVGKGSVAPESAATKEIEAPFFVQIYQVDDLDKNNKLLAYLRQLPIMRQVEIVSVQADSVTLEINAKGGIAAFQQAVEADKQLIPTTVIALDSPADVSSTSVKKKIDLQYDWKDTLPSTGLEY